MLFSKYLTRLRQLSQSRHRGQSFDCCLFDRTILVRSGKYRPTIQNKTKNNKRNLHSSVVALVCCISRAKAKLASTVGSLLSFYYIGRICTKQRNSGFASQWSAASAEAELAAECQLSSLSAAGPRLRTQGCAHSPGRRCTCRPAACARARSSYP